MARIRKPPKRPKAVKKKRRSSITLVTRNGVLVAVTPADRRGRLSLKEALAQPVPRKKARKAPSRTANPKNQVHIDVNAAIAGLPNRTLSDLRQMWLNLIRIVATRALADGEQRFRDALIGEWSKRAKTAECDPDHFEWPSTDARSGDGSLVLGGLPSEGILAFLGYRVGVAQGLSEQSRKQILDVAFASPLPPINGRAYMQEWASPGSATRLKKIADALASFTRNAKRKRVATMDSAIADWEHDLEYLYYQYYVGKFAFAWPTLEIG